MADKEHALTIAVGICDTCDLVHLVITQDGEVAFSKGLTTAQWDEILKAVAMLQQAGVPKSAGH